MISERSLFEPRDPLYGENSTLFSGRSALIESGLDQLKHRHSIVMYYGDLGIGKSSVARQLYSLLISEKYAVRRHSDKQKKVDAVAKSKSYGALIPLWISCRDYRDFDSLLKALCFSTSADTNDSLSKKFPDFASNADQWLIDLSLELKFGPAKLKAGTKQSGRTTPSEASTARDEYIKNVSGIDLFFHLIGAFHKRFGKKEYILFLDDFKKLVDREKFNEIFFRSELFRYVLVGIAENPADLIAANESIERHLVDAQYHVGPLAKEDVNWLFSNACEIVKNTSGYNNLSFSSDFVDQVYLISKGLPLIAQFYGWRSLIETRALEKLPSGDVSIDVDTITSIEQKFFDRATSVQPTLISAITEAIGNSLVRPKILRILATRFESWFSLRQARNITELSSIGNLEDNIDRFIAHKIIVKSELTKKYKFSTPTARMFCLRVDNK